MDRSADLFATERPYNCNLLILLILFLVSESETATDITVSADKQFVSISTTLGTRSYMNRLILWLIKLFAMLLDALIVKIVQNIRYLNAVFVVQITPTIPC